jgi:hypothetical protein
VPSQGIAQSQTPIPAEVPAAECPNQIIIALIRNKNATNARSNPNKKGRPKAALVPNKKGRPKAALVSL